VARAFVAKAVFNFPLTRHLIDRLRIDPVLRRMCGFETVAEIPEEWTFSRAFAEFAESQIPQRVHAALIERTQADRLVCHISRDSTAIEAREKVQPQAVESKPVRKSRSKKKVTDPQKMTSLQRQASGTMTVEQMLAELPCGCDVVSTRDDSTSASAVRRIDSNRITTASRSTCLFSFNSWIASSAIRTPALIFSI
jgi:hypothetical protein